jgi:hypothetical protein
MSLHDFIGAASGGRMKRSIEAIDVRDPQMVCIKTKAPTANFFLDYSGAGRHGASLSPGKCPIPATSQAAVPSIAGVPSSCPNVAGLSRRYTRSSRSGGSPIICIQTNSTRCPFPMGEGRGEGSLRRGNTARAFPRRRLRDEARFTWEVEEML